MSTLHPGKTSAAIVALREAAIKEMDAPPPGVFVASDLKFDAAPLRGRNRRSYNQDDNGVSRYAGQNSEHIGNGSGSFK